jgi:hypothetical protein
MAYRGRAVAAAAAAALVLGLATPALARQLDAKDDPKASDNLTLGGKKCATQRDKHNGKVVAVIHSCQRFYTLDTSAEDDAARDYGVFWLQSTIDPATGWCATSVASDIVFTSTAAKIVSTAPVDTLEVQDAGPLKTALDVDADGHASQSGRVSQRSRVYPEKLETAASKDAGKTRFRVTWTGRNGHALALVSGAQVSWATDDGPPKTTRFGLRKYTLVQKDAC